MKKKKVGEILRDRGKISPADLDQVVNEQRGKVIQLGELMLERGLVCKEDLAQALEEVSLISYIDCASVPIDPRATKLIPRAMAERYCALSIRIDQKNLVVAMATPQDLGALNELRFTSGMEIVPRLSFRSDISAAIKKA